MNTPKVFSILLLVLSQGACDTITDTPDSGLILYTNQTQYHLEDDIVALIRNQNGDTIRIIGCGRNPFKLQVYDRGSWSALFLDDCILNSEPLAPEVTRIDTVWESGSPGLYRVAVNYSIPGNPQWLQAYSNSFIIVE